MKPKILYLLPYFGIAGTEIHTLELAKSLREEYQILVVTPYGKGIKLLEENDIPYREVVTLTFTNVRRYKNTLNRIIEEFNPNIIHVHGAHELVYISKSIAPNVPVIFTCHGYFTSLPSIDYRISAFINRRWGDKVIAVSNHEKRRLIKAGLPEDKVILIYNGISETLDRRELPLKVEGFIVGTAARLTKFKGIRYLIEAFSYLYDRYKDINLVVIGDGEEREKLEELARKLGIKDRTFFLGALPNAKLYFRNFHIFVLPSVSEALSIAILEAISQKVPVIATSTGSIPEIIEDGKSGLLVPPKDPLALTHAIERMLRDEELRGYIGEEGYRRYRERFTLEGMITKTREIYRYFINCST